LLSVFGSACWFAAMTLQNAALVRALGQVELIFTVIVSWFGFRESPSTRELAGMALIAGGVVTVLMFR
jgi:drug/metabolite transporter (DMT)-like permease